MHVWLTWNPRQIFYPCANGKPEERIKIVGGVKGVRWEWEGGRQRRHVHLTGSL